MSPTHGDPELLEWLQRVSRHARIEIAQSSGRWRVTVAPRSRALPAFSFHDAHPRGAIALALKHCEAFFPEFIAGDAADWPGSAAPGPSGDGQPAWPGRPRPHEDGSERRGHAGA